MDAMDQTIGAAMPPYTYQIQETALGRRIQCLVPESVKPDEVALHMLEENRLRFFAPLEKRQTAMGVELEFVAEGESLFSQKKPWTRSALHAFLHQLDAALQEAEDYLILPSSILLDPEWITLKNEGGLTLVADPFHSPMHACAQEMSLLELCWYLIRQHSFSLDEDLTYLGRFINGLKQKPFDREAFSRLVADVDTEKAPLLLEQNRSLQPAENEGNRKESPVVTKAPSQAFLPMPTASSNDNHKVHPKMVEHTAELSGQMTANALFPEEGEGMRAEHKPSDSTERTQDDRMSLFFLLTHWSSDNWRLYWEGIRQDKPKKQQEAELSAGRKAKNRTWEGDFPFYGESTSLLWEEDGAVRDLRIPLRQQPTLKFPSQEEMKLEHFPFRIGRAPENDGVLRERHCSTLHAQIVQEKEKHFLIDQDSTNGTFLNNQRLKPFVRHLLHQGDRVRFGNTEAVFLLSSANE